MQKDFDKWNKKKKQLDAGKYQPPFVSEGEIWWASVGENVGSEIGGKSDLFSRPVIIFKKLAHGFYFVIPTTSQERKGSWYVTFRHRKKQMTACLQQARAIDYRRLSSKLGTLDDEDFVKILEGFEILYVQRQKFPAKGGRAAGKSRM
jgi:mRNA interferase MazF